MVELFRRLLVRPVLFAELLLASLFINVLALASTIYVMQVLSRYVSYGVDVTLTTLTVGVVLAAVLEYAFRTIRLTLAGAVSRKPDSLTADTAYSVLLRARMAALERVPAGLRQEATRGVDAIERAFSASAIASLLDVPFALLFVVALFFLSPILAGIALGCVLLTLVIAMTGQMRLRQPTRQLTETTAGVNGLLSAALDGGDTVRAFNGAGSLSRRWTAQRDAVHALRRRVVRLESGTQSLTAMVATLQGVAIVCAGAIAVVRGDLDVAALIGANILGARALAPVARLGAMSEALVRGTQALRLLRDFVQLPIEPRSGTALAGFTGRIEVKDLGLAFAGGSGPLFESVALHLDPGVVLAVVGPNGSGKTSFLRLLVGVLEPSRGQILIDGVDLRQLAPEWWRQQLVYQPQEPTFLPGTIAENIRVNRPDIDDATLARITQAVGLRRFIDTSAKGFETPLVEGGRSLSLGVRRRIALARALATDGRIVLLDEPTEGLDAEGHKALYALMTQLARSGRSIIVVTHDPAILRGAHWVLDLGNKPVPQVTAGQAPPHPSAHPSPASASPSPVVTEASHVRV